MALFKDPPLKEEGEACGGCYGSWCPNTCTFNGNVRGTDQYDCGECKAGLECYLQGPAAASKCEKGKCI